MEPEKVRLGRVAASLALGLALVAPAAAAQPAEGGAAREAAAAERPRARDVGIVVGELTPGPHNAITDVPGVRVGHATVREGDSIRTGVTAILPPGDNAFREKVRAAIAVGNGFGKLVGLSQVNELGEIETPILLTGTLNVFKAADALVDTLLSLPGNRDVRSINPVVGETNDGFLSDIRARPIRPEHVRAALRAATAGPVVEGSVGAGTGTTALGWKGGIGTASRRLPSEEGGYTVGVLVQTNYGGSLRIVGAPVGEALGSGYHAGPSEAGRAGRAAGGERAAGAVQVPRLARTPAPGPRPGDGSVMIVVATDAPLVHRELERIAFRTFLGIARTGSHMSHGSGDYAIAFSTSREPPTAEGELLSSLFQATVEATEEAVLNSLFRATTVVGYRGRRAEALPVERAVEVVRRHGLLSTPSGPEGAARGADPAPASGPPGYEGAAGDADGGGRP